jgi:hypothetical protein
VGVGVNVRVRVSEREFRGGQRKGVGGRKRKWEGRRKIGRRKSGE